MAIGKVIKRSPEKIRKKEGPSFGYLFHCYHKLPDRSKKGNGLFCHIFRGSGPDLASRTTAERESA